MYFIRRRWTPYVLTEVSWFSVKWKNGALALTSKDGFSTLGIVVWFFGFGERVRVCDRARRRSQGGELVMEVDNGQLFPRLQPMFARNQSVVLVGFAVTVTPGVDCS